MMVKRFNPKKKEEVVQKKLTPTAVKEVKEVKEVKKKEITYKGIYCDSYSETYCLMWLFELQEKGYIKNIRRAKTYILFNTVVRNYVHQLKRKRITKEETLHRACQYSPDFEFDLTEKGLNFKLFKDINYEGKLSEYGKAFLVHQNGLCVVEVKGTKDYDANATEEKWSVVNKWLWNKEGVYVNLWTSDIYHALTFTPKEMLFTPVKRQLRKLKWKVHTIEEYIKREK